MKESFILALLLAGGATGQPGGFMPTGSMSTGLWVVSGTRFFLQDGSGGKPLMAANTLAQLTVIVRP